MSKPSQTDLILHALSLQIAATYHIVTSATYDDDAPDDIKLAYRSIRRHISKGDDGKRYGANEAHRMMQGGI